MRLEEELSNIKESLASILIKIEEVNRQLREELDERT